VCFFLLVLGVRLTFVGSCNGNTIEHCDADGSACSFVEDCTTGCLSGDDGAICTDRAPPSEWTPPVTDQVKSVDVEIHDKTIGAALRYENDGYNT
jgi:hypothetical protein